MVEYLALPQRRYEQISRLGMSCVYAAMTLFLSSSETLSNTLSAGVVVSFVIFSSGSVAVAVFVICAMLGCPSETVV